MATVTSVTSRQRRQAVGQARPAAAAATRSATGREASPAASYTATATGWRSPRPDPLANLEADAPGPGALAAQWFQVDPAGLGHLPQHAVIEVEQGRRSRSTAGADQALPGIPASTPTTSTRP